MGHSYLTFSFAHQKGVALSFSDARDSNRDEATESLVFPRSAGPDDAVTPSLVLLTEESVKQIALLDVEYE